MIKQELINCNIKVKQAFIWFYVVKKEEADSKNKTPVPVKRNFNKNRVHDGGCPHQTDFNTLLFHNTHIAQAKTLHANINVCFRKRMYRFTMMQVNFSSDRSVYQFSHHPNFMESYKDYKHSLQLPWKVLYYDILLSKFFQEVNNK